MWFDMTFVNAHFFLKTLKAHKALIGFICIILSCTWAKPMYFIRKN